MARLEVDPHLHEAGYEERFRATFKGQAHIAGTGPAGAVCRQCFFWMRAPIDSETPWFRHSAKSAPCNYVIRGKSGVMVPASAPACRFFKQHDA